MCWRSYLNQKVVEIRKHYRGVLSTDFQHINLNGKNARLFLSCQRWHTNMHTSDEEVLKHLAEVDKMGLLDVKEKMKPIPSELKDFLDKKFKKEEIKDRFTVHDLFDNVMEVILEMFKEKLDSNKEEFEFELSSIVSGTPIEDLTFFERVFLPAAVFYTYQSIHRLDVKNPTDLMEDVFSIGGGAKTENLIPEMLPLCAGCAEGLSETDISNINLNIFQKQLENQFKIDINYQMSDDGSVIHDEDQDINPEHMKKPIEDLTSSTELDENCEEQLYDIPKILIFNPFEEPSCSEFECTICIKQFSRLDFLNYHMLLFHVENDGSRDKQISLKRKSPLRSSLAEQFPDCSVVSLKQMHMNRYESSMPSTGKIVRRSLTPARSLKKVFQTSIIDNADDNNVKDSLKISGKDEGRIVLTQISISKSGEVREAETAQISDEDGEVKCTECSKLFSRIDFLKYHKLLFHDDKVKKSKQKVVPIYVDEGMELMETFCLESTPEKRPSPKKNSLKNSYGKRVRKVLKYPM